jgi:hypothetical protein
MAKAKPAGTAVGGITISSMAGTYGGARTRRAGRFPLRGSTMKERKPTSPGTSGYPEPQPRRNDKKDMPGPKTPHEHQNDPARKPKPSGH